jgi:hypothetical protein
MSAGPTERRRAGLLIDGYLGPDGDASLRRLLTEQLAFWFWLDDRFDGGRPPAPLRWDDPSADAAWSALAALDASLWALRQSPAHRQRWRESAAAVVRAMARESLLDAGTHLLEYVDLGATTSTVPHLFVTLGWFLDRSFDEEPTAGLVRQLALEARLENDLRSIDRDRAEGTLANAVLLLAAQSGSEAEARREVEAAHGRVKAGVDGSLVVDPVVRAVAGRMRATHAAFYADAVDRYASQVEKRPGPA